MDTIKDNMNSFLGVLVIFVGLIFIPEIRRKRSHSIPTALVCLFMLWLGCDKIKRDNAKEALYRKQTDSFKINIDTLKNSLKTQNNKNEEFLNKLEYQFKIYRDSSNSPKLIKSVTTNFNNKVRTVNIRNE